VEAPSSRLHLPASLQADVAANELRNSLAQQQGALDEHDPPKAKGAARTTPEMSPHAREQRQQ